MIENTKEIEDRIKHQDVNYIFVRREVGTWHMREHFKGLKYATDDDGWWFSIDDEPTIRNLCEQSGILSLEFKPLPPIAKDLPDYKRHSLSTHYIDKEAKLEEEIQEMLVQKGISDKAYPCITDNHLEELSKTPEGKKLVDEFQNYQKKVERISNEEIIANISPASKTSINEFEYLLECNSEKQIIAELRTIAPSIKTGYHIEDVDIEFPGGALTIIAGQTGHGKTTTLINFSLGVLNHNPEKNIYFFSCEEARPFILMSYLNAWMDELLTDKNNMKSMEEYFRDGSVNYIQQEKITIFKEKKDKFFKQFIDNGRLKIFYTDMKTEELVRAISYINERDENVGLICVDYMQLLKTDQRKTMRHEELKEVCSMLKDCSINTGLPIVLAAQFNRTVLSEKEVLLTNIGEGGDIERSANMAIGIFNRNKKAKCDEQTIEEEPGIYMKLLKNRHGKDNISEVFNFDGNLSKIKNKEKIINKLSSETNASTSDDDDDQPDYEQAAIIPKRRKARKVQQW